MSEQPTTTTDTTLYCANHPNIETTLRCNRCNKPICARCAVLTPTGYKCKECVRGQQKAFETAEWIDYPVAFAIAGVLAFLGSLIASRLGFLIIFLAPIAGGIIAEILRAVTRRHRSKRLYQIAALGALCGCLPYLLIPLLASLAFGGTANISFFLPLIWQGLYTFLLISSLYYRLVGIRMG